MLHVPLIFRGNGHKVYLKHERYHPMFFDFSSASINDRSDGIRGNALG